MSFFFELLLMIVGTKGTQSPPHARGREREYLQSSTMTALLQDEPMPVSIEQFSRV
jgi:hypothetical protein